MKAAVGKKNLLPYKIFAIIINVLLILSTARHLIYKNYISLAAPMDFFPNWFFFVLNGLGIIISFYLIFKPQRLELYGVMSLLYSIMLLVDSPSSDMGLLMYLLFIITLYLRGFLKKHPIVKLSFMTVLYIALLCTELRYGTKVFINSFVNKAGILLILVVIFYLIMKKHNEETYIAASNKTLDLRNYQSLSERDKEWIKLVLKETKYDEIAKQYKVTS